MQVENFGRENVAFSAKFGAFSRLQDANQLKFFFFAFYIQISPYHKAKRFPLFNKIPQTPSAGFEYYHIPDRRFGSETYCTPIYTV